MLKVTIAELFLCLLCIEIQDKCAVHLWHLTFSTQRERVTEEPRNGLKGFGWYVTHVSLTFLFLAKVYHVAKTGINGIGEHLLSQDGSTEHFMVTDRDGEAQHTSEHIITV